MKKFMNLLVVAFMLTTAFALTSCINDKDDEPYATVGRVKITNASTYTFEYFGVYFMNLDHNDGGKYMKRENKGTVKPGQTITVNVPIGATHYYAEFLYDGCFLSSEYYSVSELTQVLTDQIIDEEWYWDWD